MSEPAKTRKFVAKNESVILRAISDTTQTKVAEAIGHDAGYVSRFLSGQQKCTFSEVLTILETCGLAVHRLSDSDVVLSREDYDWMTVAVRKYAETLK